jgi:hypothetical protein
MIDISPLEQYFPQVNKSLVISPYTFTILFRQESDTFLINLKIKQQDTKAEHLIGFRFGIGKDEPHINASHNTATPHFEIDLYRRAKEAFSATIYFTFSDAEDENILAYAKGTISLIRKLILNFVKNNKLDPSLTAKIMYDRAIADELTQFEPALIEALYQCYKNSDLIVREGDSYVVIKTPRNFRKYLGIAAGITDLDPLFMPLQKMIGLKG